MEQWDELIVNAELERECGALDVLVVDTLAAFLPGRSESDPGTLLDMLTPLRRLAAAGAAVLVLHHPRRAASESGSAARGSGALLGFVDVILELSRLGNLGSESCRRKLSGLSRFAETPLELVYEWTPGTAEFRAVANPQDARYLENWETVHALLKRPNNVRDAQGTARRLARGQGAAVAAGAVRVVGAGGGGGAGAAVRQRLAGRSVPVPTAAPQVRLEQPAPAPRAVTRPNVEFGDRAPLGGFELGPHECAARFDFVRG